MWFDPLPLRKSFPREALAEVVRESVREAVDEAVAPAVREALDANRSQADRLLAITVVGGLFAPAVFVYGVVAGFADPEDAAYWSIVMLLVTVIAMYNAAGGRDLLRRIADWWGSDDDD